MESMVTCTLSADALSEIRRKVHTSRKDASLPTVEAFSEEIISHDVRVIAEFIAEEFEDDVVELFKSRVRPEPWPEILSWDYPGPWINPVSEIVMRILEEDDSAYIFSKSGSHNLNISKII